MSCAEGTFVRTGKREFTEVQQLFEGANLYGERGEAPALVTEPLQYAMQQCVIVETAAGHKVICEADHSFRSPNGGYVTASESLGRSVRTSEGSTEVIAVRNAGLKRVVRIHSEPLDQPYETNGILS